jgi:hypothetical protein
MEWFSGLWGDIAAIAILGGLPDVILAFALNHWAARRNFSKPCRAALYARYPARSGRSAYGRFPPV